MFMSVTAFQKLVTVSIWMLNDLLLYERGDMLLKYELSYNK